MNIVLKSSSVWAREKFAAIRKTNPKVSSEFFWNSLWTEVENGGLGHPLENSLSNGGSFQKQEERVQVGSRGKGSAEVRMVMKTKI